MSARLIGDGRYGAPVLIAADIVIALVALILGGPATVPGYTLAVFGLACVAVAGIYGGATVSRRIVLIQTLPAAIGLILVLLV